MLRTSLLLYCMLNYDLFGLLFSSFVHVFAVFVHFCVLGNLCPLNGERHNQPLASACSFFDHKRFIYLYVCLKLFCWDDQINHPFIQEDFLVFIYRHIISINAFDHFSFVDWRRTFHYFTYQTYKRSAIWYFLCIFPMSNSSPTQSWHLKI